MPMKPVDLIQTQEIILHVGQGFSLVKGNPKGLPYKIFNAFVLDTFFSISFQNSLCEMPPGMFGKDPVAGDV
jgi:hypothetical protein